MKTSKPVPTVAMGRYMQAREIAKRILSSTETESVTNELLRDLLGMARQLEPSERMQIYTMVKNNSQVKESGLWRDLVQFNGAKEIIDIPNFDGIATADEYQDCAYILHLLSSYCAAKSLACKLRLRGDIEAAQAHEHIAEGYYRKLPQWARW